MANLISVEIHSDERGSLGVVEDQVPFAIKRVFYIFGAHGVRGGHRHLVTSMALISVVGSCAVQVKRSNRSESYALDSPSKLLILEPEDWHTMQEFSNDCVLLVLASHGYDKSDYAYTVLP